MTKRSITMSALAFSLAAVLGGCDALDELLSRDEPFDYAAVRDFVVPDRPSVPEIHIDEPNLGIYDQLVAAEAGR